MPQFGGFISDKLEIKFLILYIAARLSESVPFEALQELSMCDEGVDYFDFSQCMADLVRTEHLRLTEGRYAITDKGRSNSAATEDSLPTPCGCRRRRTSPSITSTCAGTP